MLNILFAQCQTLNKVTFTVGGNDGVQFAKLKILCDSWEYDFVNEGCSSIWFDGDDNGIAMGLECYEETYNSYREATERCRLIYELGSSYAAEGDPITIAQFRSGNMVKQEKYEFIDQGSYNLEDVDKVRV